MKARLQNAYQMASLNVAADQNLFQIDRNLPVFVHHSIRRMRVQWLWMLHRFLVRNTCLGDTWVPATGVNTFSRYLAIRLFNVILWTRLFNSQDSIQVSFSLEPIDFGNTFDMLWSKRPHTSRTLCTRSTRPLMQWLVACLCLVFWCRYLLVLWTIFKVI